jgi:tetratricopeptide (TPR) repeat protein
MENLQVDINEISKFTVRIKTEDSVGTGVIVTGDGLILTCYHVIKNLDHKTPVDVYFPSSKVTSHANVVDEYCNSDLDIAFLQLQDEGKELLIQPKVVVAKLSQEIQPGNEFWSFGFKIPDEFIGLTSTGHIRLKISVDMQGNGVLQDVIQLDSSDIEEGMSGAPVFDTKINRVVGIISRVYRKSKLALAIPIESIIELPNVYVIVKEKNPGLLKIFEFLEKIGLDTSDSYSRFDDLYVAPLEYPEIEKTLRENRVVFITGAKEYGKTYTAMRLLLEYYKKDYEPNYISKWGEDLSKIIERLLNLDRNLKHHVLYIEDPVGKTEYVSNEDFERNIVGVIDNLAREDAYIIITMREEIYKKFHPVGKVDPLKVVKKLSIHSYDYEKRKEMLLNWASISNCKWLENKELIDKVLEVIKDERKLSTPLNIKDFANATSAEHEIANESQLLDILDEKSKETAIVFANEIKNMKQKGELDKILFLSFPFISDSFSRDFVKAQYQKLLKELDIRKDDLSFERVLNGFQGSKVDVSAGYLRFSHPSYSEALSFILTEDDLPSEISTGIFSKVLLKLVDNKDASRFVILTIVSNFRMLSDEARNLILELKNAELANIVASVIAPTTTNYWREDNNFDKLPEDARNQVLIKLVDKDNTSELVARVVETYFYKLPIHLRNELLVKLADKEDTGQYVSWTVRNNFYKLPIDIRNELLIKLVNNADADPGIAFAIIENYEKLPENIKNILFTLADKTDYASHDLDNVLTAIIHNYEKLPENIKNIYQLAGKKDTAQGLAFAIARNYEKLPENIKNILFTLADKTDTVLGLGSALCDKYCFGNLPDNIKRELLIKLIEKNVASAYEVIEYNSDQIPPNLKIELLTLVKDLRFRPGAKCILIPRSEQPFNTWITEGDTFFKSGRYDESIKRYDNALKTDPKDAIAWSLKGLALLNLTDLAKYDEAITCFDKAVQIRPDFDVAWNYKGMALYHLKRYDEAITCFDKVIQIRPDFVEAWNYYKGMTLAALAKYDESITCFDKVIQIRPDFVEAWNYKGMAFQGLAKYEQAIECYNSALGITPNLPDALYNRACSKIKTGDIESGLVDLKHAIELRNEYIEIAKEDEDFKLVRNNERFNIIIFPKDDVRR